LSRLVSYGLFMEIIIHIGVSTFPAPAGPITRVPNLLIVKLVGFWVDGGGVVDRSRPGKVTHIKTKEISKKAEPGKAFSVISR
jgi:hypothetical protein